MPQVARSLFRRTAALVLATGLVAVCIPLAVRETWHRLAEIWTLRGESVADARRRIYGDAYWSGIEALRSRIPRNGSYVLSLDASDGGLGYWIRFDLAPRKPVLAEREVEGRFEPSASPGGASEYVVSARGSDRVPVLLDPTAYRGGVPTVPGGREDRDILASIDEPAEGEQVRGVLVVSGWCQERGGRPCATPRILLDAEYRAAVSVERFPRRDVEVAVPGIGDCSNAGYRVSLREVGSGPHVLWVLFRTGDGRYRPVGPRRFTVER